MFVFLDRAQVSHHTGRAVNATVDDCEQHVSTIAFCFQQLTTPAVWWWSRSVDHSHGPMPCWTGDHINIWTYFVFKTRMYLPGQRL